MGDGPPDATFTALASGVCGMAVFVLLTEGWGHEWAELSAVVVAAVALVLLARAVLISQRRTDRWFRRPRP